MKLQNGKRGICLEEKPGGERMNRKAAKNSTAQKSKEVEDIRESLNGSSSRKSKRNVPVVNYKEPEVPKEDRYIYCDVCGTEYLDECPRCGLLVALRNTIVPMGAADRARKTVPRDLLVVRASPIHGEGVFALRPLRQGVRLGPYQGELLVAQDQEDEDVAYGWLMRDGSVVDAADETRSNWLRYVNCSRNAREQNLVAYQYRGKLYYRSCRDIKQGEELLVFYGEDYAKKMGINVGLYYKPPEDGRVDIFFCDFCPMGFRTFRSKELHMSRCVENTALQAACENLEYWTCRYCKVTVTSEDFLKKHEKACTKRHELWASGSTARYSEENHKKMTINEDKQFTSVPVRDTNADKPEKWRCELSNYTSNNNSRGKKHVDNQHKPGQTLHKCGYCEYTSTRKSHVKSHEMHKHTHEKPFHCQHCPYASVESSQLRRHIKTKHKDLLTNPKASGVSSNVCNTEGAEETFMSQNPNFSTTITRREDKSIRNETGITYQCDQCEYNTVYKPHMTVHKTTHEKIKPFICPLCKRGFSQKQHLVCHVDRHVDKPGKWRCHLCIYTSNRKYDLKRHMNIQHTREILHKCGYCEYTSSDKSNVKRHEMHKHTHEKPFHCQHCPYASVQSSQLRSHIKRRHPVSHVNPDEPRVSTQ